MFKFRNLLSIFLLVGLVLAELLTNVRTFDPPIANSQTQFTPTETALLGDVAPAMDLAPLGRFITFEAPDSPGDIATETILNRSLVDPASPEVRLEDADPVTGYQSATTYTPGSTPTATPNALLADVVPLPGTELYFAYQDGGRAWYEKGANVLVIFPDETINSFNKRSGARTTWLQDRLAYPPVDGQDAYYTYQSSYRAKIVAEASSWVLMEFPSLKVLKVAKPRTAQGGAGSIYNLPPVLPGYGATP